MRGRPGISNFPDVMNPGGPGADRSGFRTPLFATTHWSVVLSAADASAAAEALEQLCRATANRAWIESALRLAEAPGRRGLVLLTHANPWVESRDKVYDGLLAQVAAGARRLAKPLLFIQGDTHTFRVDSPFRDGRGARVENARRLESFGSPVVAWVRVSVDPNDSELFRFEPHQ